MKKSKENKNGEILDLASFASVPEYNVVQKKIELDISSLKKEMRRFKIVSNFFILATIIIFAVLCYVFFSNDPKQNAVIWPEYDYTKPFNPYSDKNPNQSITVGDPAYDSLIDNTNSPTPLPGWYQ